jgi:hypothetical protein
MQHPMQFSTQTTCKYTTQTTCRYLFKQQPVSIQLLTSSGKRSMAQASDVMVPSSAAAAVGMIVCVLCDDP